MPRRSRSYPAGPKIGDPAFVYAPLDASNSLLIGSGTYQGEPDGPGTGAAIELDSGEVFLFDTWGGPFRYALTSEAATAGELILSSLDTYREDYHEFMSGSSIDPLPASLAALPPMVGVSPGASGCASVESSFRRLDDNDWIVVGTDLEDLSEHLVNASQPGYFIDVEYHALPQSWYLISRIVKSVAARQRYLLEDAAEVLQTLMLAWSRSEDASAFVDAYVENPWLVPIWSVLPASFVTKVVKEAHSRPEVAARDLMVSWAKWSGDADALASLTTWPVPAPPLPETPLFEIELWVDGSDLNEGFDEVDHPKACVVVDSEADADDVEAYARTLTGSAPKHRGRVYLSDTFFTKRKKVWPEVYPSTLEVAKKQFEIAAAAWGGI